MQLHQYSESNSNIFNEFRINCKECCGLCCVALYFSKFDGFPADKAAGTPCNHLDGDFCCSIHKNLGSYRMKGCLAYDCLGAGQLVTAFYEEKNWRNNPEISEEMFSVFIKVFHIQQVLWYLSEASILLPATSLWGEINQFIEQLRFTVHSSPSDILAFDLELFQDSVNPVLKKVGTLVKEEIPCSNPGIKGKNFMGYHFKQSKLDGYDFSSAYLIAADLSGCSLSGSNFLGADLRDVNIKNADLSESIFLTQGQISGTKGDKDTRIPPFLTRPLSWS